METRANYALVGLFLFPTGWTLLSAAVAWTHGEPFAAVANTSAQLWLAKHVGVGAGMLPFLLLFQLRLTAMTPNGRYALDTNSNGCFSCITQQSVLQKMGHAVSLLTAPT